MNSSTNRPNSQELDTKSILSMTISAGLLFVARLLPHLSNLTPVFAIALLMGFQARESKSLKFLAVVLSISSLVLSDFALGLHSTWAYVYLPLVIVSFAGSFIDLSQVRSRVLASAIMSFFFYLVSNFGVWEQTDLYTHNISGLVECYIMAVPFLLKSLVADQFFTQVFYYACSYIQKNILGDSYAR